MTLSRQLIVLLLVLFMLMFAGTFLTSLSNTRDYLGKQLESSAQDVATSLGLSLSPHMLKNDLPTMISMTDAIFDSGYYREVVVESVDGTPLIARTMQVKIEGVPTWFVNAIPLETPRGEALVTAGWKQAAKVYVRSHPGLAYAELWRNTVTTFWWFLGSASVTLLLGIAALRLVLKPLRAMEQQAEAISAREFPVQEKLPWTRDLRRVVMAMNRMTLKIKQMFEDQTQLSVKLHDQAYKDLVTGLGNRRYFDSQLQHLIQSSEEFLTGALLLVQLRDFKRYNEQRGYAAADELLRQTASILREVTADLEQCVPARLAGADFAVLAPDVSPLEAQLLGQLMCERLSLLHSSGMSDNLDVAHIGIAMFREGETASELFSEADMALRAAQSKGPNSWHIYEAPTLDHSVIHGASHWREVLREVVAGKKIVLHFQRVVNCLDGSTLHHEALVRVPDQEGGVINAGVFMPMAERLGMTRGFDKLVVEAILERMAARPYEQDKYAVNLAPGSLHDPDFVNWLYAEVSRRAIHASKLIFEVPEYGAVRELDAVREMVTRLGALGCRFCLDHFGRGVTSFGYLSTLKIHYLKIDGSYIRGIDRDQDNQFFVHSVAGIARGLDIQVIAEAVETQEEWDALRNLRVDGIQGYIAGRPAAKD